MKTNRSFLILAVCAALSAPALTSSRPALAQGAPQQSQVQGAVDAATLAKQREIFQQANKLYDEGKYPQAEQLYLQAWKLKQSYDVAGNLGNLEADMNKPRAAAEYLAYAIREFPAGGRPALRDALVKRHSEVVRLVGTLRFTVSKPGAEVFLDGQSIGLSPIANETYVDPGTHSVEARLEGYLPVQVTINAQKGKTEQVDLTFLPPKGANKTVIIAGGAVAGAAIVVGAALLGVGASKGSTASSLLDDLRKSGGCPPATMPQTGKCADLKSALDSKGTLSSAGLWTLVGGGVVGIGTLVYALAGGSKPGGGKTGVTQVTPLVTGDGGGLVIGGAF
jgi:hypothetical protein